jgi:hypothetical protein
MQTVSRSRPSTKRKTRARPTSAWRLFGPLLLLSCRTVNAPQGQTKAPSNKITLSAQPKVPTDQDLDKPTMAR